MPSFGSTAWKLAYEISPIVLSGGLAENFPFKAMPIVMLTDAINFPLGVLGGGGNISLDKFFAHWRPVPGGTLLDQDVAEYPFATQQVAANAVITKPQTISMLMDAPAQGPMSYFTKLATMELLRFTLYRHNMLGGTYHVATPGHLYTDCLMRSFKDVSTSYSKQVQTTWQLDFSRPLVTVEEAERRLGGLYDLIDRQVPINGEAVASGTATAGSTASQIGAPTIAPGATSGASGTMTPVSGPTNFGDMSGM